MQAIYPGIFLEEFHTDQERFCQFRKCFSNFLGIQDLMKPNMLNGQYWEEPNRRSHQQKRHMLLQLFGHMKPTKPSTFMSAIQMTLLCCQESGSGRSIFKFPCIKDRFTLFLQKLQQQKRNGQNY